MESFISFGGVLFWHIDRSVGSKGKFLSDVASYIEVIFSGVDEGKRFYVRIFFYDNGTWG